MITLKKRTPIIHFDKHEPTQDFVIAQNNITQVAKYLDKLTEGMTPSNEINNDCVQLLKVAISSLNNVYECYNLNGSRSAEMEFKNHQLRVENKKLNEIIIKK